MLQIYVTIGEKTARRGRKGGFGLTSQEKKEFLSRYLKVLAEEKDIREEIAYWESKAQKVTASWSAVPSGGKGSDKVQMGAIKVAELRESLMDKINQLASESFDGQIESHTMLFYGICGDCLRKS